MTGADGYPKTRRLTGVPDDEQLGSMLALLRGESVILYGRDAASSESPNPSEQLTSRIQEALATTQALGSARRKTDRGSLGVSSIWRAVSTVWYYVASTLISLVAAFFFGVLLSDVVSEATGLSDAAMWLWIRTD
jgi:hypothetical protein